MTKQNTYPLDQTAQEHLKQAQFKLNRATGLLEMFSHTDFDKFDQETIASSLAAIVAMLYDGLNELGEV